MLSTNIFILTKNLLSFHSQTLFIKYKYVILDTVIWHKFDTYYIFLNRDIFL